MNNMNIIKGDTVIVLSGKDKGKKGKVLTAIPDDGKVIVEGVNVASKHQKARREGQSGGIVKKELPLAVCKVMVVCSNCNKPTRIAHDIIKDKKVRVCKHCGKAI